MPVSCSTLELCFIQKRFSLGLAGLTVAYELTLAGHDVVVYEANGRAGGRVFTYDTGKTIIELGGMRLPLDIHRLTNNYIRQRFQLPLEPFVNFHPTTFISINGMTHRVNTTNFFVHQYNLHVK